MSLSDNTTALQAVLAAINTLPSYCSQNCKTWTYTNASDTTSPITAVAGDSDVAAHYNSSTAMCSVLYCGQLDSYNEYGSGFATNVLSGTKDGSNYYGATLRQGSSGADIYPQCTPLSTQAADFCYIYTTSSGDIYLSARANAIRPAGTYVIVFSW